MQPGAPLVRAPQGVALALFALVWLSCAWFGSFALNPNNATRLFAALAIVEHGDATIDRYQTLTIDKAHFGSHYYMDKAPGVTLMAVPALAATRAVTGGRLDAEIIDITNPRLASFLLLRMQIAVATTTALLTAFAAVLLLDLGTGIAGSPAAGLFAALGYALGSIVWGWSTTLFGHAPVAALLMIATWAIWRGTAPDIGSERDLARWRYPLMAGGALGWAAVIEFPSALGGIAIGAWAIWRSRNAPRTIRVRLYLTAFLAAAVAGGPLVAYNQLTFGTPFKLGYQGVVGFGGMQEGLFGLTYPKPYVLFEILFGLRRGLLWVAPVLVLGAVGLWRMVRSPATRDLGSLAVAVVGIVLAVNASYAYWDGGASVGPRHSVPAIPFLALGLAPFWASLARPRARVAAGTLLAVSMALNLIVAATDIFAPESLPFPLWQRNIAGLLPMGRLSTIPSDHWGWSPWFGFALYLDIALPLLALLLWATRRAERSLR